MTRNRVFGTGLNRVPSSPWHAMEKTSWPALIPCLSIRQPWAWLIVRPDLADTQERSNAIERGLVKDIENRSWPTKKRGPILIHASKGYSRREHLAFTDDLAIRTGIQLPPYEAMQRGGIIGSALLKDCLRGHSSQWKIPDHWGFVLEDAKPIPFTPWRGQLGWFLVPMDAISLDPAKDLKTGYHVAFTTTG